MVAEIPIVKSIKCQEFFTKAISSRMFCAGTAKFHGCKGDRGAGLIKNNTLYGLLSFGEDADPQRCDTNRTYPDVYINISILRPWITNVTGV